MFRSISILFSESFYILHNLLVVSVCLQVSCHKIMIYDGSSWISYFFVVDFQKTFVFLVRVECVY